MKSCIGTIWCWASRDAADVALPPRIVCLIDHQASSCDCARCPSGLLPTGRVSIVKPRQTRTQAKHHRATTPPRPRHQRRFMNQMHREYNSSRFPTPPTPMAVASFPVLEPRRPHERHCLHDARAIVAPQPLGPHCPILYPSIAPFPPVLAESCARPVARRKATQPGSLHLRPKSAGCKTRQTTDTHL
jgi:hypothetical protein